jgi:ribonuclease HI
MQAQLSPEGAVFKPQIDRNIQAYIDDLIVKSSDRASHVSDLAETFTNMGRASLKLNPEKCVFGVTKGKILGCLISAKRIEANPDKIRAIREMEEPKTKKDIQKLNGRVAALNRFFSRSAERSLPFFKALKGKGKIEWGPEQREAFAKLKEYIEKMTILSPPAPSEPLFLYVAASKAAVGAVLVREVEGEKGKLQSPVYFVSEALSGSKLLYSELEKMAYAVVMATQKLRHYFEAQKVTVLTDQPLNDLFINKEASSRIAKWATELSEHTIDFGKRSAIKSQVLADFVVDWTSPSSITADEELVPVWEIRCDRAWGRKGAGIAAIITSPAGIKLRYAARLDYKDPSDRCTNNTTKYEALLLGLRNMRALGAINVLVKCDAKAIKDHVEKESEAREPELVKYLAEVRKMERHFRGFTIEHLPRKNNGEADELTKKAARREEMPPDVFFEILTAPSTRLDKQPLSTVNAIASLDWRAPIIAFLRGHYEPVETHDFKRMQARAKGYILKDNNLFKLGVCAPLLKCITQHQGMELMKEIHGGMCRSHVAARALAGKAFRQGFYWPMAIKMPSRLSRLAKLVSSQPSTSEGLGLHRSSSLLLGRYNAGEWTSLDHSQQPKAISSSLWSRSNTSPSGLR